jgi:hypothetical protein
MTTEAHTLDVGGRRLVARVSRAGRTTAVVLEVDGVEVGQRQGWPVVRVPADDLGPGLEKAALVVAAPRPGRGTVRLVVPAAGAPTSRPERLDFEPPTGTAAHRRYGWARRHPRLYAARHVVVATAEVVAGLLLARIALGFVLDLGWGWLPDWHLPRLPRPDLPDLPDLPWPDLDLPDWSMPGWLAVVLASKKYWFPILVATGVAVAEVRRRRRRDGEKENAAWPGPSTPRSTPPGGSRSSTPDSPASPLTATTERPRR